MYRHASSEISDALVIGAGPAGSSAAILLAQAGWRVSLVEQHRYPRQKVCGECVAAGNFALLDELGVGSAVRRLAGCELTQVGWMHGDTTVISGMPPCTGGPDQYGRAVGRDVFDELLLQRARAVGVRIFQPAKVRKVSGTPGNFRCEVDDAGDSGTLKSPAMHLTLAASLIIDAHGSWESGPQFHVPGETQRLRRPPQRNSDLFAFKASFANCSLRAGVLPVVALEGGYGGIVVANEGRTTLALCLRRDTLRALRSRYPSAPAALAVETHLRRSCYGIREALHDAHRLGSWRTVGPLRPGIRIGNTAGVFRVGNASGESHPLIGEGISMALQSSKLLVEVLSRDVEVLSNAQVLSAAHRAYEKAWRQSFRHRVRLAALYAQVATRRPLAVSVGAWLRRWPQLPTTGARFADKARRPVGSPLLLGKPL